LAAALAAGNSRARLVPTFPEPHPAGPKWGYLGIAGAAAGWGTWGLLLRLAQRTAPVAPQLSVLLVMSIIFVVVSPLALRATRRRSARRPSRQWALLAAFGLSDALNAVLYFAALQTTSVSVAVLTHYAAPLFVAVSAPLALRERRHPRTLPAVLLGFAGLTLLLAPWNVHGSDSRLLWGALLGLGSAVFYAVSVLFNKHLSATFDAAEMLVYHLPSALILVALLVPAGGWVLPPAALPWLVLGALGPGALCGVLFMRSLARVPAAHAATLTLIEPVTALLLEAIAWREGLPLPGLFGAAAILAAGAWVVRDER
jgi:drug/metabolite transporter (DMT)-like permease